MMRRSAVLLPVLVTLKKLATVDGEMVKSISAFVPISLSVTYIFVTQ